VLQEGGQQAHRTPLSARTMTAAHAGTCRDAGMRAWACAAWQRGEGWGSRRRTRGGVHWKCWRRATPARRRR